MSSDDSLAQRADALLATMTLEEKAGQLSQYARQNIPVAGKLLAQNLIQRIETGRVTNVTVPVELVIRQSA